MIPATQFVAPPRQRMIDDMRMRKLEPKTRAGYIRAVRNLAAFLERSPDTATVEDLRRFQLHMVDRGSSPITGSEPRADARWPDESAQRTEWGHGRGHDLNLAVLNPYEC